MLRFYELDFAIVDGVMPSGRYSSILLGTDYLCLIASPDHPFAKRSSVTLDELTNEKLVLRPKAAGTRKLFEGYLISHGRSIQDYRVIMEIDSVSAIKEIVAGNLGVSIISHNVCHEEEKSGKLAVVPIENCRMVRQLSLVFPPTFSIRSCCASCRPNTAGGSAEAGTPRAAGAEREKPPFQASFPPIFADLAAFRQNLAAPQWRKRRRNCGVRSFQIPPERGISP